MGYTNQGLIRQLSVGFLIGGGSQSVLASFVVGSVAILGLAWHFGISFETLQFSDFSEQKSEKSENSKVRKFSVFAK